MGLVREEMEPSWKRGNNEQVRRLEEEQALGELPGVKLRRAVS